MALSFSTESPFPKVRTDDGGLAMLAYVNNADATLNTAIADNTANITTLGTRATALEDYNVAQRRVQVLAEAIGPAAVAWNINLGGIGVLTLTHDDILAAPTNAVVGMRYALVTIQDATGGRNLTFDAVYENVSLIRKGASQSSVLFFLYYGGKMLCDGYIADLQAQDSLLSTGVAQANTKADVTSDRVDILEDAIKIKKAMILCNRKPRGSIVGLNDAWCGMATNIEPATGWIGDLGIPLRFADLMYNKIPGAAAVHIVTSRSASENSFRSSFAVHKTAEDSSYAYLDSDAITRINIPTGAGVPSKGFGAGIAGIDVIVRARYTLTTILSSAISTVDGIGIATDECILAEAIVDPGVYRKKSDGSWAKVNSLGKISSDAGFTSSPLNGSVQTVIHILDGDKFGGKTYAFAAASLTGSTLTYIRNDGSTMVVSSRTQTNIERAAVYSYALGAGIAGETVNSGWESGSGGFPTWGSSYKVSETASPTVATAVATGTSPDVESGYTVLKLPAGVYKISGDLPVSNRKYALILSKFNAPATGFSKLSTISIIGNYDGNIDGAAYMPNSFTSCFSIDEESYIALHTKPLDDETDRMDTGNSSVVGGITSTSASAGDFSLTADIRRGTIAVELLSDTFDETLNDLEVGIPGFASGYIASFYNKSNNTANGVVGKTFPSGLSVANISLRMDWSLGPQNARIIKRPSVLNSSSYSPSTPMAGEALPSGVSTVPPGGIEGPDYKFLVQPFANRLARYYGYIRIPADGKYAFRLRNEEAGACYLGLEPDTGDYFRPGATAAKLRPILTPDGSDSTYTFDTSTSNQYIAGQFGSVFASNVDGIKTKSDNASPGGSSVSNANRLIYLRAGMYPFIVDSTDYGDTGHSFKLEWNLYSAFGKAHWEVIPAANLYHTPTQWTDVTAACTANNGWKDFAAYIQNTYMVPSGSIAPIPDHRYI